jgi:hypothetical protein
MRKLQATLHQRQALPATNIFHTTNRVTSSRSWTTHRPYLQRAFGDHHDDIVLHLYPPAEEAALSMSENVSTQSNIDDELDHEFGEEEDWLEDEFDELEDY